MRGSNAVHFVGVSDDEVAELLAIVHDALGQAHAFLSDDQALEQAPVASAASPASAIRANATPVIARIDAELGPVARAMAESLRPAGRRPNAVRPLPPRPASG